MTYSKPVPAGIYSVTDANAYDVSYYAAKATL
jgi:hypothetical protein